MERVLAQLASNTTLLETTERNVKVQLVRAVDPCGSSFELVCGVQGTVDVLREDGSGETVF